VLCKDNPLKTQTERLDNHTARLVVDVEPERLEQAKVAAAKKLSRRLNIPGFRRGKAPYRIIANYVGEGALLEEAVEELGNQIYQEALDEAQIEPYGPGQLEDVKVEGQPVFTFTVPLQPTVDLNDYRDVRVDYTVPEITDDDVNRALKSLQEQFAVVEESHRPVEPGNRITAYIDARLVDEDEATNGEAESDDAAKDEEPVAEAESGDAAEEAGAEESEEKHEHEHIVDERTVIHEHDASVLLDEDTVPAPGFIEALTGAVVGETREFVLTYPDEEAYGQYAGKPVKFTVTVNKIETVTLPALNDELAARATADEKQPLTLLELRMRIRENLERSAREQATREHGRKVLDEMVKRATIRYPEAVINDQIESYLRRMDSDLRQRGLTLDDYLKITQKTRDDLYADYRDVAISTVERALVMRQVAEAEGLEVTDEQLEAEIESAAANFGEQANNYRRLFRDRNMRESLRNDMLSQKVMERISLIGRGEAPELVAQTAAASDESTDAVPEEKGESA